MFKKQERKMTIGDLVRHHNDDRIGIILNVYTVKLPYCSEKNETVLRPTPTISVFWPDNDIIIDYEECFWLTLEVINEDR